MVAWLMFVKERLEKACAEEIEVIKKVDELIKKYQYMR